MKPRPYTESEVQHHFLEAIRENIRYWHNLPDHTLQQKLEGVAFSILVILDGEGRTLPGFIVAPSPHCTDKGYHIDRDENWYPEVQECTDPLDYWVKIKCDIAGNLHKEFYSNNRDS